ncbi:MAG: hypothetical protein Ct9H300mP28_34760 [Pseudomonadota bacterium]|nr:MAG: hypothetical protein Ct9H300mP28_34760 [Pseudomonadota bacterium]
MMDLTFIRQGYKDKGLDKEDLNTDPVIQFESWFEEAKKSEPIPTAMSLSTVNNNGEPTLRIVLLKLFDKKGFVFFTNYKRKESGSYYRQPQCCGAFQLGRHGATG